MNKKKLPFWLMWMTLGGAVLSSIAQLDLPILLKEMSLMLPLQIAAFGYVIWYWRDRPTPRPDIVQHRKFYWDEED